MSGFVVYRDLFYTTITVFEWQSLLESKQNKKVILDSFSFLHTHDYVKIYAFVIMSNHLHVLWEILDPRDLASVVHSFKSYTANELSRSIIASGKYKFEVNKSDRKIQIWKKNSLSVEITTPKFLRQKFNYIHDNPRRAGLVLSSIDYKYCSYKSYCELEGEFEFLTLLKM